VSFGNVVTGTISASRTLTLSNTGTGGATGIAVAVATTSTPTTPNQFARAGGTCGTTLAAGASCTITVTFSPTTAGAKTGTVTITASVTVSGSPVALSGTGVAATVSASLTPPTWNATCTGAACTGLLTAPTQILTLTNTGNATLTGITQGVLGGTNANQWTITRPLSTCGPAGGGQMLGQTTLAPGASCIVTVRCINPNKQSLFTIEERVALAREVVEPFDNVDVQAFEGLTVHFVRRIGARIILRGLRTLSDMEYEFSMTLTNNRLDPEVETVFLMADGEYSHVSSGLIKQVARFGGGDALDKFVPPELIAPIMTKMLSISEL